MSDAAPRGSQLPRAGFVVLAIAWFVLFGLALVRPAGTALLREGEDAGRTTVHDGVGGEGPAAAWLQVALLAMSPTALDEEILVAHELPLWSGRSFSCTLDWLQPSRSRTLEALLDRYPAAQSGNAMPSQVVVERQRELGSRFPWWRQLSFIDGTPEFGANELILREARLGLWPEHEDTTELTLRLPFDQPLLVPQGETALLLRVVRTANGAAALAQRATWRSWFGAAWSADHVARAGLDVALATEQQALAGMMLREDALLRAAQAARPLASMSESAPWWRRLSRTALSIARGERDDPIYVHPRSLDLPLGWRALRIAANDASAQHRVAWLLPALAHSDFAAGLLASEDAANPVFAPLVEAAHSAVLPTWLRAVPWLWPLLLAASFVVLVRMVRSPQRGVAEPIGVFAVLLLGMSCALDHFVPLPLLRWAVMFCLCVTRWRSMDRTWRSLAAAVLVTELAGALVPFGLLPNTPVWPNLTLLASSGCWVLVRGLVAIDERWIAPGLLTAFTAMALLGPAAMLVPGCAWIAVQLVLAPTAWLLLRGFVLFGFVLCGVRYFESPSFSLRPPTAGTR